MPKIKKIVLIISIVILLSTLELLLFYIIPPFGWSINGYNSKFNFEQKIRIDNTSVKYLYYSVTGNIITITVNKDDSDMIYEVGVPNDTHEIIISYDGITYNDKIINIQDISSNFDLNTTFLINNIITKIPNSNPISYYIFYFIINLISVNLLFLTKENVSKKRFSVFRESIPTYIYKLIGIVGLLALLGNVIL